MTNIDHFNNIVDLARAAIICRLVERTVEPLGYHCGLSGSVLFDGISDNDLDVFLYKHNEHAADGKQAVLAALRDAGFVNQFQTDEKYVEKDVVASKLNGASVDFFFVSGRRA